jgi:hypothetical protein
MRPIKIEAVLNGWVVSVGCQKMVYSLAGSLLKDLGEYMLDPEAKEKSVGEYAVNRRLLNQGPQQVGLWMNTVPTTVVPSDPHPYRCQPQFETVQTATN